MKRRVSTEEDFMNHTIDDLLWGYMACLATYNDNILYLSKEIFAQPKVQTTVKGIVGAKTIRTVKNHLDNLKAYGLISEDENNFYFPYDIDTRYVLVDRDLLEKMVIWGSRFIVKIYAYLFSKYQYKPDYKFTKKELAIQALGYPESSSDNKEVLRVITICLEHLEECGILAYAKETVGEKSYMIITKLAV